MRITKTFRTIQHFKSKTTSFSYKDTYSAFNSPGASILLVLLIFLLVVVVVPSYAANHYIKQGAIGNATGVDWTNAWTDLPATFVRGDIYYVADGTYSGHIFDTASSGTTPITIKKSTVADHGTATGYVSTDHDGVATFNTVPTYGYGIFTFSSSYWVLDGISGGGPSAWTTGHGFRVITPEPTAGVSKTHIVIKTGITNITLRHLNVGPDDFRPPGCDYGIYVQPSGGVNDITVEYCYVHHQSIGMTILPSARWTIQYNRLDRIGKAGDASFCHGAGKNIHGSGIETYGLTDSDFRYNSMSNVRGSGWIGQYDDIIAMENVRIYGNTFFNTNDYVSNVTFTGADSTIHETAHYRNVTPQNPTWFNSITTTTGISINTEYYLVNFTKDTYQLSRTPGGSPIAFVGNGIGTIPALWSDGIIYTTGGPVKNLKIYNNTFAHLQCSLFPSTSILGISNDVSGNEFKNNIVYGTYNACKFVYTGMTRDHNASDQAIPGDGNIQTLTSNPFQNWESGDFRIKTTTQAGLTLSIPYNKDVLGSVRASDGLWDRGAFEFPNGQSLPPASPANFR